MKQTKLNIISALLFVAAMAIETSAWAQDFSIEATYNSSTHKTLFTIERSGSSLPQQTIKYRTVNLSAYAGVHYTAVSNTYTFPENITSVQVEVSEYSTSSNAFQFQNGTTRSYRFEVLDVNGFQLAYKDRSMTTGTSVPSSGAYNVKDVTIYSDEYWADDGGYDDNGFKSVLSSHYFNNAAPKEYFQLVGAELRMTLTMQAKEEDDAYQYLQILFNDTVNCDNRNKCDNGDPGNQVRSIYMAGFEIKSGVTYSTYKSYTFPVISAGNNEGASNPWGYGSDFPLDLQKFNTQTVINFRADDGRLILPLANFNKLVLRLNASGSSGSDKWWAKNVVAHIQAVEANKPTLINGTDGITVSAGPYVKGNTFYISVPFSEIVHVSGGSKQLNTSWGNVTYVSGDYTNVITFEGTINTTAGTTLAITGINNCMFNDLAGNYDNFSTSSFNKTFNGVTCTESYTLEAANTEFTGLADEYVLSNNGPIQPHPTVYFYKGKKESANKVQLTENTNYTLSWANNNTAGNGRVTATGTGIYTGSASTTFPIRWSTYTVSFHENGSTAIPATGTMSDQAFQYGVAQNLTANAFSREGFTFAGWNTEPDGNGTAYSNEQSLLRLTPTDGAVIDLYAQWALIPWTGSGDNANDPYIILYASQLDLLATNVNSGNNYSGKFFKLDADITYAHTTLWNDATSTENNYTAIGTSTNNFRGTFDGDNHTISGIRIYNTDDNQGLFGYADYATIKNVILTDARITCYNDVGGIAGYIDYATTIQSCLVSNAAITGNNKVGAVVGFKYSSTDHLIYNYYLGCIVKKGSTTYYTGIGLGQPQGDYVNEVASLHTLSLSDNITASGESVVIDNVTYYAHLSTITLGYTGAVDAGYNVNYQYNDGTAHAVVGNTFKMPGADVTVSSTFTDVWGIADGADGSQEHPYIISDTTGLNVLAQCVNGTHGHTANSFNGKFFKLGADITYSHTTDWDDATSTENNYTAIGNGSHFFRGTFDGDGHTISGIRIYKPTDEYQGLFGFIDNGTMKNLAIADARITGDKNSGGITGQSQNGDIMSCHVANNVIIHSTHLNAKYHGGIVGLMNDGSIVIGCISEASLTMVNNMPNNLGGIVGYLSAGTVEDCLFTGTVPDGSWCGAIAGYIYEGLANFTNNYYTTDGIGGVNGSDCDGARRARTITLGENVGIAGDQTAYDVSGLTAFGTTALSYNNGTSTTIYSGATQTVTLSDAAPQGCVVTSYSLNGTPLAGNSFTMPDSDVTVSATIGVPYIDADGNERICTDYTLIESSTGSTVILGAVGTETWYAVCGNVNITVSDDKAIKTYGAVHLILMDGATLTVGGQYPIFASGSLSIYGQSLGTGSLTASGSGSAIYVYDGTLTINGGIVTATSSTGSGIWANNAITINGGNVSASGNGIQAIGTLTLGWHNASDRIYASSYYGYSGVAVKSGQYLSDGTAGYSGTLSTTQVNALAGKTLQPAFALTLPKYVNATSGALVQEGHTAYAQAGANVTIAGEGCTITNVTVGGEAATDNGDGTWSFIMPANDVTVSATVTAIDFTTGHAGTEGDPYIIMYRSQLDLLATRVNGGESYDGKFLKLGADIAYDPNDLDDNGENYTAIGTKVNNYRYFNGSFDGDGHIVSGIRINKTGQTDADKKQGLFGYVYNAFIKNVVLSDASITGYTQVGGIVGDIFFNNTIQNCLVLNSHITAANNTTNKGAIAGFYTSSLTLTDNYYYNCTVDGVSTNVGVGGNSVSDSDGARCVNKLTLCEHVSTTPAAAVTYQGKGYYLPGTSVTLSVEEGYTLNDSYSVKDANNNDITLTGGDTFEMPASDVTVSTDITIATMDGSGTEDDPWIIMYRSQMDQLAISEINNGEYYQLGRDLTYSYEGLSETESNYTPIRVNEGGHFDGAGHTISGIRIYPYDDFYDVNKGLFSLNYGTVKNVTLTDAIITGEDYVGGIVGSNTKNGLIDSCHVTSTVIIKAYGYSSDYHGGISGDNAGDVGKIPSIRNCTSAATITNNGYENCIDYGGIVGENVGGIVSGCTVYEANITATDVAGGIVGYNYWCCDFEDPVVENCVVIGCTIVGKEAGAISCNSGSAIFNHNYYYNCTANGNTTDIGTMNGDITENDGAVPATAVSRTITGYGDSTESDHWAFIASPMDCVMTPHHVQGLMTTPAEHYDLYRFNQDADLEWQNYKAHTGDFNIENGKGYLYASKEDVTLTFLGTPNSDDAVNVSLSYTEGKPLAGFNLVGNPFAENATLNKSYYSMNAAGTGLVATATDGSTPIAPCTGVIVQATEANQSVTFTKVTRGETSTGNGSLNIALGQAQGTMIDNAIVSFDEGSQLNKFYFGEQNANIYILQDGKEYAIVSAEAKGEVPVNFKAKKNGEYTLTVSPTFHSPLSTLHLIDNLTGADIDLLQTPSYTFNARTSDYASRFKLVFNANGAEGNDDFAFIDGNGNLIVNGSGIVQIIDIMGHVLVTRDANDRIGIEGLVGGVYVLRFINGENVKTQKIVVK
ncbi:MAG: InlB B-repeat-containing protein [Bacteroidales bacterium]|nr:InlB B-repeat-containing protein [Bacteroidales bacterium]